VKINYQVVPKKLTPEMRRAMAFKSVDVAYEAALANCENGVLEDLFTHLHDFKEACRIAMIHAPYGDCGYWNKQYDTITRIETALKSD
jgi:hypothetical protein